MTNLFLSRFLPVRLVGINKDSHKLIWKDFDETDPALAWAEKQNAAGFNIYYTVNQLRHSPPKGRGTAEDIGWIRALVLDFDPKGDWQEAQAALDAASGAINCTYEIHSGRGRQVVFVLHGQRRLRASSPSTAASPRCIPAPTG